MLGAECRNRLLWGTSSGLIGMKCYCVVHKGRKWPHFSREIRMRRKDTWIRNLLLAFSQLSMTLGKSHSMVVSKLSLHPRWV